jgi:hypothetical protein
MKFITLNQKVLSSTKLDLKKQIDRMCPTPNEDLFKKFEFFYAPYNYRTNIKKYLTYNEDEDQV